MDFDAICGKAEDLGAHRCRVMDAGDIVFEPELVDACRQNYCGNYGRNWMCPPSVGEPSALIEKARKYARGMLLQTVSALEDSFDFEGMAAARERHIALTERVAGLVADAGVSDMLVLGAGGCAICERCTKIDDEPCRFPERARASMEAYGVYVAATAERCGMKYINGANTVTYFSLILFNAQ